VPGKGDRIYLAKPLGIGLITTGIKREAVSGELIKIVTDLMTEPNRKPAELMVKYHATAATDVTGYGLLGHAFEVADTSGNTIRIFLRTSASASRCLKTGSSRHDPRKRSCKQTIYGK